MQIQISPKISLTVSCSKVYPWKNMKIQKKDQKKFCDRQTNQLNQPTKNHGKT